METTTALQTNNERLKNKSYIDIYNLMKTKILHYPKLDTMLMVEKYIKKYDGEFKKKALWRHLPKRMMYQTFSIIIQYLLESGKISVDSEGKIGWIYYPKQTQYYYARKDLAWKK